MKTIKLCLVAITAWLASCTAGSQATDNLQSSQDKSGSLKMEKISNAVYDGESVTVTVISHGCTKASHFALEHRVVNGQCELSVVRTKPDLCRRAATPITVGIAWTAPAECAELPLVFANPVLTLQNRAAPLQIERE